MSLDPVIVYSQFTQAESEFLQAFAGGTYSEGDIFYVNALGVPVNLALGTAGQALIVNPGETAPIWSTPAGGGDVVKVGTPVDGQVGVWTGNGTIEGDTALTFDTTTDSLIIAASGNLLFGAVTILDDNAGTMTLSNIDALDATTEATIEAAIDTLANLASVNGFTFSVTGNATVSGTNTGDQTSVTGNAGTVTTQNEAADTTCFISFASAASGSLPVLTNANMTFNASTGVATFASVVLTTADINGGTVDGAVIGGATPAAGTFTTVVGNSFVPNSATVPSNGMYLPAANTLGWAISSAAELALTSTALYPATNDGLALGIANTNMWADLFLASGAVINLNNGDVTITHAANQLTFAGATTNGYLFADGPIRPSTNDGVALGTATVSFSDLFLATGAVINFNNGDVTLTHGTDVLTFAGAANGFQFANAVAPSTNDGAALGTTALGWADLYLATGGNILVNNANARRTLILTAAGGSPTTTSGCAASAKVEAATNDVDYYVLDFDATTQEFAFWNVQMPDNWDGSTITARFVWTSAAGGAGGTVVWGIAARAYNNDDAIDQAYGTAIEVSDDWIANGDVHITADTAAITVGGSPAGGRYVAIRVYRDPADANDDLTGDARLMAVQIEYGINAYSD